MTSSRYPTVGGMNLRQARRVLREGDPAPDFELASDEGATVRLSELRGKPVVLFFYPKVDTPPLQLK